MSEQLAIKATATPSTVEQGIFTTIAAAYSLDTGGLRTEPSARSHGGRDRR